MNVKCKHSWDRTDGVRYCIKCDRLQQIVFPGYANLWKKDKWIDIGENPFTKKEIKHDKPNI